jgi:hypothetical protein
LRRFVAIMTMALRNGGFKVTSEARNRPVTPIDIDLRDWRPGPPARSRPLVAVGLGVIVSLVLVAVSVAAGTFVVHTMGAALSSGSHGQIQSGSAAGSQRSLELQSGLVEQRRAAVAAYAAKLAEFKAVTARLPGAPGINLDAAEVSHREDVLTGLVLECIDAVNGYNLAAQARSATQLQSAGLPERFVWVVDCAAGR